MPIVVGIDEAGLGPVLGPMVTTAVWLDVPAEQLEADLWTVLASGVARKASARESRVVIADSKTLSAREDGLAWLERGALAALALVEGSAGVPATTDGLLARLCPEAPAVLADCPWYGADAALPLAADRDGLGLRVRALAAALADAHVRLAGLHAVVLFEPAFNDWIERTRNKAQVCWQQTSRLIYQAVQAGAEHIQVDHQGGRQFYLDKLRLLAEGGAWQVLDETAERSAYAWTAPSVAGPRRVTFEFRVKAEQASLAVAWASLVSKYGREAFMHRLNAFFAAQQPGVKPTAGYRPDGERFLADVAGTLARLGLADARLRRVR